MTTFPAGPRTIKGQLNNMAPAAKHAALGDCIDDLITNLNADIVDAAAVKSIQASTLFSSAGLAIKAGSSAIVKSSNAVLLVAGGTYVALAAGDLSALVGTLATAKSAAWAFYVDSAGTVTTSAKTADAASAAAALALLPAPPVGKALLGIVVISNATGSNFVGGTTALDVGSLTVAYYNTVGPSPILPAPTAVAVKTLPNR